MKKHVLFIQGGGDNGYAADAKLADSLQAALGNGYEVNYPELITDKRASDFGWPRQIGEQINNIKGGLIVVAHSVGASLLLKYLSQTKAPRNITAVFLMATPWWSGNEDWVQGLKLPPDIAARIPETIPIFLYHSKDDKVVPFEHLATYEQKLPQATIHKIKSGGHQFNNDLAFLAEDIKKQVL